MQEIAHRRDDVEAFLSAVENRRSPPDREIQERAVHVFTQYCKLLCHFKDSPLEVEDVFPVDPQIIIRHVLQIKYFEVDTIEGYEEFMEGEKSRTQIAGLIDRDEDQIVIAKKFRAEWRRYTAAHEIGHWLLHPDVTLLRERLVESDLGHVPDVGHRGRSVYLRERPITGHELGHHKRPPAERQADLFAAELLMPIRHVVKTFFKRFGGPLNMSRPDEEIEFWFNVRGELEPKPDRLANKRQLRPRSRLVANATSFRGALFPSLVERYGVSQTAMAIQLENLGLVF